MSEEQGSWFKKFFHARSGNTADSAKESEASEGLDAPDKEPPAPDPSPDAAPSDQPPEDALSAASDAPSGEISFPVSPSSHFARLWSKYGPPTLPVLSLFPSDIAATHPEIGEMAEKDLNRLMVFLNVAAQDWMAAEATAQTALTAEIAAAAEAAAKKLSNEDPATDASQESGPPPESNPSLSSRISKKEDSATPVLSVDETGIVVMSRDGLIAWMFLLPAIGNGKRLNLANGRILLKKTTIRFGVDSNLLNAVFDQHPWFKLCPVAFGVPPVCGTDGYIHNRFPEAGKRQSAGDDDANAVDFRAQSAIRAISAGEVICDIVPPVNGQPGTRVDGDAIPAPPVKHATPPAGQNTFVSDDGTLLLAVKSGLLEYKDDRFQVKDVLNIRSNVDYSTGNIDFQGDVTIHGDVRELFSVKATGNITIDGLVEAAIVEAGGDVVISRGVSGNSRAVIRGNMVRAKYFENCTVYAENIESDYIMSSRIFCNDSVRVSGRRGSIIGGQLIVSNSVKATSIGSDSGRATEIELGAQPEIREKLIVNRQNLTENRAEVEEITKRILYLKRRVESTGKPLPPKLTEEVRNASARLLQLGEEETALLTEQTELTESLSSMSQCRLESQIVYPGVRLAIGGARRNITSVINHCIAVYGEVEGDIVFR